MSERLPTVLKNKAEQVARAAEFIMAKTTDWQIIKEFMSNRLGEIELTDVQKEKKERYQYVYNQRVSGRYTDAEIANQLTDLYKIQISQAYEDMNCSSELFTSIINVDKMLDLKLKLEINKSYQRKCLELGDMKTLAKFEKNGIEIAKLLEDAEDDRGELFEGHVFEVAFDPTLLEGAEKITKEDMINLMKEINARRSKKISTDMFEELDFENAEEAVDVS